MAIELKTDGWRRYMMYRRDEQHMTFEPEQKRREAAEAGKKFVAMAYADVWAKDGELVKRVRAFLGKNFHWHDRLVKSGADLDVVQTLKEMVRGDSVVVIPEDAMRGGSVGSALLPPTKRAYSVMDPETAAEMRAIARSFLYPPGEAVLSGPYRPDREACGQLAAARAAMVDSSGGKSEMETQLNLLKLPRDGLRDLVCRDGAKMSFWCYWYNETGDRVADVPEDIRAMMEALGGLIEIDEYRW